MHICAAYAELRTTADHHLKVVQEADVTNVDAHVTVTRGVV